MDFQRCEMSVGDIALVMRQQWIRNKLSEPASEHEAGVANLAVEPRKQVAIVPHADQMRDEG